MAQLTEILSAIERGDERAREALVDAVYQELHSMAQVKMKSEPTGITFQATMLVHDALERLLKRPAGKFQNRKEFFAAASKEMRRILIEAARRRNREKRGAKVEHVPVEEGAITTMDMSDQILLIHEALQVLQLEEESMHAELVELRYFLGLKNDEAAEVLGLSSKQAEHAWRYAKAWLLDFIEKDRNSVH